MMAVKHIITHPLTIAALLVIVTPLLIISYWLAIWLLLF